MLGLVGIFIPLVSLVGVVRLASPSSAWARRLYDPGGRKLARSRTRWKHIEARRKRIADTIAGAPGAPVAIDPKPTAGQRAPKEPVADE